MIEKNIDIVMGININLFRLWSIMFTLKCRRCEKLLEILAVLSNEFK